MYSHVASNIYRTKKSFSRGVNLRAFLHEHASLQISVAAAVCFGAITLGTATQVAPLAQ